MLFFLILSFIVILLNILIIGILLSSVIINIEDLNVQSNSGVERLTVSIDLYLFKVIKVLSIKLNKEYLKVAFVKIYYYKILKYKNEIINNTVTLAKLLLGKNKLNLNILNPKIETFYMNLSLCSENAALTSITSSLIGSTTSMILSKYVKKYDEDKIFYKIIPVYFNFNGFKLEIRSKINLNAINILVFLYDYYLVKNNK